MNNQQVLTILALDELKNLGYNEVWIGNVPNPHWPKHNNKSFIIASPKIRINNNPALWDTNPKVFGQTSCGNGLKNADQVQKSHNLLNGHFKLENDQWTTI